jgi:two-component system, response regulator
MTQRRVLLVDDDPSDVKLTLQAFQRCGVPHDMHVESDGAAALGYLFGDEGRSALDDDELPNLVLLDLKLPLVDGIEILRRIRTGERTRLLPVVVLTASNEEGDVRRCYELGANAYVRKGVDFAQFAQNLKALATFWLVMNEPLSQGGAP